MHTPLRDIITIETLERRIAPAIVTVDFTGGILTLTGDAGDHGITITALDPTTFEFTGDATTQFQLGGDAPTATLRLTGKIKSLDASLGDGIDNLDIIGLNVSGDITIDTGDGANTVEIGSLTAKGSLTITGGTGNDQITLGTGAVMVKQNVTLDLADGANIFRTTASIVQAGALSYTGGSGADSIELVGSSVSIQKNASFVFGTGNASLLAPSVNLFVGKDLIFDSTATSAADTSTLTLGTGQLDVRGSLICRDGDGNLLINGGPIPGQRITRFEVITGEGTYSITGVSSGARTVNIDASESVGGSFTAFGFGGTATQSFQFVGGSGNDTITVATSSLKPVSINLDLGDGTNSTNLQLFFTTLKNLNITGGSGPDNVTGAILSSNVQGNITIDAGDGPSTTLFQLFSSSIKGGFNVTNGEDPGASSLTINSSGTQLGAINFTTATASSNFGFINQGILNVKGGINLAGGDGNDAFTVIAPGGGSIGKGISLELGDGNNSFNSNLAGVTSRSLTVNGGDGNDAIALTGEANLGAVNLNLGAGNNLTALNAPTGAYLIAKSFAFTSSGGAAESDTLSLARVQVLGKFSAQFGDGSSSLQIDNSLFNSTFTVDTADGSDIVNIDTSDSGTGVVIAKAAVINLGDGSDMLVIGGNGTTQLLTTNSTFEADGGAGTDTLTDAPTNNYKKDPVFTSFP